MEHDFWHQRWASGQLGFHQPETNQALVSHWREMEQSGDATVFVPLCGKSLDMLWLRDQGHAVVGNELSDKAVGDFFADNGLAATTGADSGFKVLRTAGIEIWCGDFFALPAAAVDGVAAVYDRGSLVALPPDMRKRYAKRLRALAPQAAMFLLCVEYDQSEMSGPPFSVANAEIEHHYGEKYTIRQVFADERAEIPERFRARGLTALSSKAYILQPREAAA